MTRSRKISELPSTTTVANTDYFLVEKVSGNTSTSSKISGTNLVIQLANNAAILNITTVPASSNASGTVGDFASNSTYAHYCIASNTWIRWPVATW